MKLTDKIKRYKLIEKHRELVRGDAEDMEAARRLLRFLQRGEIRLGLGDSDWRVEMELEKVGVHIRYSRNGNSAYAHLATPEKKEASR